MGAAVEKEWFYLTLGHRHGPVTHEDFCKKIAKQEVYIDSTQVWTQGMTQWVNLTDAKPFDCSINKIKSAASQANDRMRDGADTNNVDKDIDCQGASRALFNVYFYFGWIIPMILGIVILVELQVQQYLTPTRANSSLFFQSVPLILLAITTWRMAATRMKHAGYSRAHGLGVFVPIYNLWVCFICLFAPRNYKRHKKLGVGAALYILLFGIGLAGSVLFVVPKVGAKNLSPLVITESMTDYYKGKTGFTSRLNTNVSKTANSKTDKEQMKKKREIEREQSKGSWRKP